MRPPPDPPAISLPPGASRARRAARALVSPIQRFLRIEAASGVLLLVAAAVALVVANSPLSGAYHGLWDASVGIEVGGWGFARPLHFWVNDGLMTIFFFVVGLEIRHEMHEGELRDVRRAALPLAAALGGMLVPAGIYLLCNAGRAGAAGWGIPMATDIAFAVGVLTLLGRRVAPALRVLLLALAVIDDIGAILVIGFFYSAGVAVEWAIPAIVAIAVILGLPRVGVRRPAAYLIPGVVLWACIYRAGVHPTLAGVVLGLLTPVERVEREEASPAATLQRVLHPWVAFAIMPLFALANAGVALGGASATGDARYVLVGILAGLVVGKPLGVFLVARSAIASGLAARPQAVTDRGLGVVGAVAGIGFTMSIFIAQLAFPPGPLLETAKLAILAASAAAMVLGLIGGRLALPRPSAAVEPDVSCTSPRTGSTASR